MNWRTLIGALCLLATPLDAAGVVNGDFETGSMAGWATGSSGISSSNPHVIAVGPGFAANTNNTLSRVRSGNYACEVYSGFGRLYHLDYANVSQSFYVGPVSTVLSFYIAAVLNGKHFNSGDGSADEYFQIDIYSGATAFYTQSHSYSASSLPMTDDGVLDYKHVPWTKLTFDLGSYVGTTVTVQVTAFDCDASGHAGFAYLDDVQLLPPPSPTPSPTYSSTRTITATFSPSDTPTSTPTVTETPTVTPTFSNSPSFTASPTITPTFSISPTYTASPTVTASPTEVVQAGLVELRALYPNPFDEMVHGMLVVKTDGLVDIRVFNVAGEPVYSERKPCRVGSNIWDWNGLNDAGARLASGIYVISASIPGRGEPSYLSVAILR